MVEPLALEWMVKLVFGTEWLDLYTNELSLKPL